MATKVFSKALMASESVQSYVGSTRFMADDEYAEVMDGAFVVLGDLDLDGVYSAESVDYNVYKSTAPAATTDKVVVIDIAGVSEGVIAGNTYKIGVKLVDLKAAPGFAVRFRRLAVGDKFWLGEGCFASAVGENGYAALTANDVTLTPAASQPGSGFAVKIQASKDLTVGQMVAKNADGSTYEQLYLCEVVQL